MSEPTRNTRLGPVDGIAVLGTGRALPTELDPRCPTLTTDQALARLQAPPTPGAARWGVTSRQWIAPPVTVEDLAAAAGQRALDDAALADVDAVHVATSTPPSISASLAARVAQRLGLGCLVADVRGGGAGALLAWIEAAGLIRLGARSVLVIGVEGISPFLAPGDPGGALYGDGAGAVVVGAGDGSLTALAGTAPLSGRSFTVPGRLPPTPDGDYRFRSPDREYREALAHVRRAAATRLAAEGPFDAVLPYGATADQVAELAALLGAPAATTLAHTGCLGAAAIPVALDTLRRGGARPARIGAVAAAGGAVWAALAWT